MNGTTVPLDVVIRRAEDGGDGFDCEPVGQLHQLSVWGRLPAAWAGHLAMHAFGQGLTIVSGRAVRTRMGAWAAELLLSSRSPSEPLRLDFLRMARRGPRALPALPCPELTIVTQPARLAEGNLFARVQGRDTVGFLAEVLRRFAASHLQPRRFVLQTQEDQVDDWFWLEPSEQGKTDPLTPAAPLLI